ncbi:reverse transcriptase [Gossypium australe]|uniref:Reverse transcriptase n=1 Tax=Gossypium australe TaxID=47621 RepID=A0A5B6X6Z2_9ROSI|nr:reverse transcriptase [Gossypium australe]
MIVSLSELTSHVKAWNKSVYGFLGTHKRNLLKSLGTIQKAMDQSSSRSLATLEMEVRDELESVLNHEDLLWRQKARNTKFFHSRTIQRRKFNRILTLRDNNGEWCSDQSTLSDEAVKFFEKLYGDNPKPMSGILSNIFPCLKEQDIDFLNKPVLNGELNNNLIMLIPKNDRPEDFSQFRPISLCSVMYKLVIKVIANIFKMVFPNFISPEQAGFIVGKNISDNVIIAQEVIHSMRSKKARR